MKRHGSCGMKVIYWRSYFKLTLAMSIPSIKIEPPANSTNLDRAMLTVDLPAPVLPTIPIFSPLFTSKESFFRTSSIFGRYRNSTSLEAMVPRDGQSELSMSCLRSTSFSSSFSSLAGVYSYRSYGIRLRLRNR